MTTTLMETVKLERKKEHQVYLDKDGVKLPGCTTVLGILDKPALINWSAKVEREELSKCYENGSPIPEKLFYLTKRDSAADIGTLAHFLAQCYLEHKTPDLSDYTEDEIKKAELAFNNFLTFWESSGFQMVHSELQLSHNALRYGGTVDLIAKNQNGELVLLDIKTSNRLYKQTYGLQVAGYKLLWEHHNTTPISKCIILRIGKDSAMEFEVYEIPPTDMYSFCNTFQQLVPFYHAFKALPK